MWCAPKGDQISSRPPKTREVYGTPPARDRPAEGSIAACLGQALGNLAARPRGRRHRRNATLISELWRTLGRVDGREPRSRRRRSERVKGRSRERTQQ